MKRGHISWKTKCAAAVLDTMLQRERFGLYPRRWYDDAKKMTEDQFLSLFHWDHNILHETGHEDRDKFWNLAPIPILEHRAKTKLDAKVIAKGRRILRKAGLEIRPVHPTMAILKAAERELRKRKIRSRGFDKTLRKKMSGKVEKR